jgi:hypothetical protein
VFVGRPGRFPGFHWRVPLRIPGFHWGSPRAPQRVPLRFSGFHWRVPLRFLGFQCSSPRFRKAPKVPRGSPRFPNFSQSSPGFPKVPRGSPKCSLPLALAFSLPLACLSLVFSLPLACFQLSFGFLLAWVYCAFKCDTFSLEFCWFNSPNSFCLRDSGSVDRGEVADREIRGK